MSNSLTPNQQVYDIKPNEEINLLHIIQIIKRRKMILVISVFSFLILAILYNMFKTPVYESFVIAKKEDTSNSRDVDEIEEMFSMQTLDKLGTEIEIIKSGSVLKKVINELNLSLFIQEVEWGNGENEKFDAFYPDYNSYINSGIENSQKLPRFHHLKVDYSFPGGKFLIHKSDDGSFRIYNTKSGAQLPVQMVLENTKLNLPGLLMVFSWLNSKTNDKIYLEIKNIESTISKIKNMIRISAIGETNLAKLTVESESPQMAQILATTIIEMYSNVRLENKRQIALSSFQFVNNQLEDIKEKLENAENELSKFKSDNQIAIMDESSKDIIKFLSNLEGEKIKVDLELGEYESKRNYMTKVLNDKGYFDQTHLAPQNSDGRGTPFSTLLEQLSDKEIQRLVLLQKRKENHPEVITINKQIAQIKLKLAEYNQNTLISYNIIINSLRKKQSDLKRLIWRYSKKIENIPEKISELIQLTRAKNGYEKMFTLLLDKREEFRLAELSKMQDIVIIESAQISHKPVRPRKKLNITLALVLGLMVGISTIVVKETFEKKITSLEDSEKIYPFPLLSIIPKYDKNLLKKINKAEQYNNRLVTLMDDQSIYRESYRLLDLKISNFSPDGNKSMIITSCEENTGKTSVAINFAISLANRNKKVLLIDADLRKANVASILNESNSKPGLINYLTENIGYSDIIKQLIIDEKDDKFFDFITSGGTVENSSEILESEKMRVLIEELSPLYDHILIDTPPLTRIIDTMILGKIINKMILVIKPNHTFKDSVAMAIEELDQSNINVVGYIVNAGDIKKLSEKYKYGYGYAYGYPVKKLDNIIS